MKYVFVVLLVLLCAFSISTAEAEMEQPDLDEYSLLKCIDKSELVVVGTVQLLTYHDRDNVLFDGAGCINTLAHEFGHFAGLRHVYLTQCSEYGRYTMFANSTQNHDKETLECEDKFALHHKYGYQ